MLFLNQMNNMGVRQCDLTPASPVPVKFMREKSSEKLLSSDKSSSEFLSVQPLFALLGLHACHCR